MQEVFSQGLAEARITGGQRLWVLILREACDLPRLALREHLHDSKLPRYVPAGDPPPTEPPTPRWAVGTSLSLFVIPALLILITKVLPPNISSILAVLLVGILVASIVAGLIKGLPAWSLPFLGVVISFIGVYGVQTMVESVLAPAWMSLFEQLTHTEALLPRLTWQFIRSGHSAFCILLVLAGLMIVLRLFSPTRPFYDRLTQDRPQLSFILYGAIPLIVLIDFDEYRFDEPFTAALYLALAAGAWGYLHYRGQAKRMLSLCNRGYAGLYHSGRCQVYSWFRCKTGQFGLRTIRLRPSAGSSHCVRSQPGSGWC